MIINCDVDIFLQNEPLLEVEACRRQLDAFDPSSFRGKSLFFGVGLCTDKQPAVAIPFDILSLFLEADRLKHFFGLSEIIVLIADTHARTNAFMTEENVNIQARKTHALFTRIVDSLQFKSFRIVIHSTIQTTQSFQQILKSLPKMDNQYLRHELTDILWLLKHHNLGIKLGWTIDSTPEPSGHDERFFDTELMKHMSIPVAFLHAKAGRTFDKHRQKVSPYISVEGESRILLDPNENVSEKLSRALETWSDPHFDGATKHLATIVRAFEKRNGHTPSKTLKQKIQHIIDLIFGKENV